VGIEPTSQAWERCDQDSLFLICGFHGKAHFLVRSYSGISIANRLLWIVVVSFGSFGMLLRLGNAGDEAHS